MTDYFKHLPHVLPRNHQEAANRLGLMLKIPLAHLINADENLVETLSGVVLYRHLDRMEKEGVMRSIYALPNRQLQGMLVGKVTDVIVNPTWGIWSLTTAELKAKTEFHSALDNAVVNMVGLGATGMSIFDLVKKARTWSAMSKTARAGIVATVVIWGAILYNKSELARCEEEIKRRTPPMQGSPYYD